MQPYTTFQESALVALRLIIGAIFLSAGIAKLGMWSSPPEGMPSGMIYLMMLLSIVEPIGGLALIVGFLTRLAATGLAIIMVGAVFFVQFLIGASFFTGPQGSGVDYILLILAGCIALIAFGAGKFSVDRNMGKGGIHLDS
jgi:putative oxidoreductase